MEFIRNSFYIRKSYAENVHYSITCIRKWLEIHSLYCETIGNSFYIRKLNENVHYVLGNHWKFILYMNLYWKIIWNIIFYIVNIICKKINWISFIKENLFECNSIMGIFWKFNLWGYHFKISAIYWEIIGKSFYS